MLRPLLLLSIAFLFCSSALYGQQQTPAPNLPPAAQPLPKTAPRAQAVTGKTGAHGKALNTSTTASAGVETPGVQTDTGIAQQPGQRTGVHPANSNPGSAPGAPPNWEQVGQNEQLADSNAAAAARAEIGGPEGTLGVRGAMPSYSRGGTPAGSSQTHK